MFGFAKWKAIVSTINLKNATNVSLSRGAEVVLLLQAVKAEIFMTPTLSAGRL
jgi:hypothetical protein